MRTVKGLLTCCLLLITVGCTEENDASKKELPRQLSDLRRQNDSLKQRARLLADSLQALSSRIIPPEVQNQEKLRALLLDDRVGIWEPRSDAKHISFTDSVEAESPRDLVSAFNDRYDDSFYPQLQLQSIRGPIAHVSVSDEGQLAERMGSAGSQLYLAGLTYTLTSHCCIDAVYLEMEAGSHAKPGYYSRVTWIDRVQEK